MREKTPSQKSSQNTANRKHWRGHDRDHFIHKVVLVFEEVLVPIVFVFEVPSLIVAVALEFRFGIHIAFMFRKSSQSLSFHQSFCFVTSISLLLS